MTGLVAVDLRCHEVVELVAYHLDGALPPAVGERFDRHLLDCPSCDEHLAQIRRTIALIGQLREEDIVPTPAEDLLCAFRRWRDTSGTSPDGTEGMAT